MKLKKLNLTYICTCIVIILTALDVETLNLLVKIFLFIQLAMLVESYVVEL